MTVDNDYRIDQELPRCHHCGHDFHGLPCQHGSDWRHSTLWASITPTRSCSCLTAYKDGQ